MCFINQLFKTTNPDPEFLTTFLRTFEFLVITQTLSLLFETSIPIKACMTNLHKLQSNKTFLRTILYIRDHLKLGSKVFSIRGDESIQQVFVNLCSLTSSPCSSICIIAINTNFFKDTRYKVHNRWDRHELYVLWLQKFNIPRCK